MTTTPGAFDTQSDTDLADREQPIHIQASVTDRLAAVPWWVLIILLSGAFLIFQFSTNLTYREIFRIVVVGVWITLLVTLSAYSMALIIGLVTAIGQLTEPVIEDQRSVGGYVKGILKVVYHNLATLYVQIIRGVPIIVQIFYVALVVIPLLIIPLINAIGAQLAAWGVLDPENALATLSSRDVSFVLRGIIALAISYGAFSSEIFRAGIQSIEKGQIEAAQALGLSWFKVFRLIIFPQAIRRILPPLGNDFIAMLKESSLVSVLGVGEITQLGRKYAAASFQFAQTYNTIAFLYLSITLILSMGVKFMERRLKVSEEN